MHAEDLEAHDEGLKLFTANLQREPADSLFRENLMGSVEYMKKHRDIIVRFGRYPHRNALLGRQSTPDEDQYLHDGGETFDARTRK